MGSLAPVAGDDSFSVGEDQVLTANLVAGSVAGEDASPAGMPLRIVEINGESAPAGGAIALASGSTLNMAAGGEFIYDPTTSPQLSTILSGGSGSDAFSYTVAPAFSGARFRPNARHAVETGSQRVAAIQLRRSSRRARGFVSSQAEAG
jgi:hypothetical protein